MNVLNHIKEEHDEFKSLIKKIEESTTKNKKELFLDLYAKIHGHHEAEELLIFPLVKTKVDEEDKDVVREMIEEHNLGNYQFSLIERTSLENDTWDAKFSVLKEVLEHHMDEEESDFIPLANKVLSKKQLEDLYKEFETVSDKNENEKIADLKN